MFAILHTFILWHEQWTMNRVCIVYDNQVVVNDLNKRFIKESTFHSLQTILLIITIFDIDIIIFWIPSKENIMTNVASCHDFKKLINLRFQISNLRRNLKFASKISILRQKLYIFLNILSLSQFERTTISLTLSTKHTIDIMNILLSSPLSSSSLIDLPQSFVQSNSSSQKDISKSCDQYILNEISIYLSSTISSLKESFMTRNESMTKKLRNFDSLS